MTLERAIEILDPEHREHYDSIETVNLACRFGIEALEKQRPKKVKVKRGSVWTDCPLCGLRQNFISQINKMLVEEQNNELHEDSPV